MGILPKAFKQLVCCPTSQWLGRATVSLTFVCLSVTLSNRFYWEPQLTVGEFVNTDIRSPKTIEATDIEATRQAKERAKQEVPQVYRININVNISVNNHLEELLAVGDRLLASAGALPYTNLLSERLQQSLRATSDDQWQTMQTALAQPKLPAQLSQLQELKLRQAQLSAASYQVLLQTIKQARQNYRTAQQQLSQAPEVFRQHLLNLRLSDWQADKQVIRQALQDILAGGLMAGLPEAS